MTESALHVAVAQYLALALGPPVFWCSVDAGAGKLTPAAAAMAKARGVRAGLPDVLVFAPAEWPKACSHSLGYARVLGIELKTDKGRLSPVQRAAHGLLEAAGVRCHVCRSVDEVEEILRREGLAVRATTMSNRRMIR